MFSTPSQLQRMLKLLHKRHSEERKGVYTARPADVIPWEIRELRVEITLLSLFSGKITFLSAKSASSLLLGISLKFAPRFACICGLFYDYASIFDELEGIWKETAVAL
jgi:hypothetical protein